jgi:glucose-1-phosphate thymidylyltransferase
MKGILLAGGSGSRLYPMTEIMSKQLLPVYDKPMIHYPLSTLMLMGIREIMIISTPIDLPRIKKHLGDGSKWGLNLSYKVQEEPKGIAEAFILAEDFIEDERVCLILGDNIFYLGPQINDIAQQIKDEKEKSIVFGYHVPDPERFGVLELSADNEVLSIEEKPKNPKSNYAAVGLYFYQNDVIEKAKNLKPSARGELEITDINVEFLKEDRLSAINFKRGSVWLDAGTPESLYDASEYMRTIFNRQGLKISCLEEVAFIRGFISREEFKKIIDEMKDGIDYKQYLQHILKENKLSITEKEK